MDTLETPAPPNSGCADRDDEMSPDDPVTPRLTPSPPCVEQESDDDDSPQETERDEADMSYEEQVERAVKVYASHLDNVAKDEELSQVVLREWWHDPDTQARRAKNPMKATRAILNKYQFKFHDDSLFHQLLRKEPNPGVLAAFFRELRGFLARKYSPAAWKEEEEGGDGFRDESQQRLGNAILELYKAEYPELGDIFAGTPTANATPGETRSDKRVADVYL